MRFTIIEATLLIVPFEPIEFAEIDCITALKKLLTLNAEAPKLIDSITVLSNVLNIMGRGGGNIGGLENLLAIVIGDNSIRRRVSVMMVFPTFV